MRGILTWHFGWREHPRETLASRISRLVSSCAIHAKREMTPIDGNHSQNDPQDFVDPKGYWADDQRSVRRTSGSKDIVLIAADACTKAEWAFVLESLGIDNVGDVLNR